jgi:hypothetical protein
MNKPVTLIGSVMLAAALGSPSSSAGSTSPAKVLLSIEPVLVDAGGLHPLTGTTDWARLELGSGGAQNQVLELEPDRSDLLIYRLAFDPAGEDRIRLKLERSRERRGAKETLSPIETTISVLDMWSDTIFEDPARRRRIVLRVVPELRVPADDEPLDSGRFVMRLYGGPLIKFGRRGESANEVVFSQVNMGGAGVEFGIPGFGVIRLHLKPFPGAAKVGWVRGTTMGFDLGGASFQAWSVKEILPEDPERPGKGWILYGALAPWSDAHRPDGSYYGGFDPGK